MEVTNVSPSPTSFSEEDDLCEIDVTNVAIQSVELLISLFGLAGNGAVLCLLDSRCLSGKGIILAIRLLTLLDFLLLLFLVPSTLLFLLEDVSCSIIMPLQYVQFLFWVPVFSYTVWLYVLTFISIQRCRPIHCPLWHCCHHPQHLSKVMYVLFGTFSITVAIAEVTMYSLCLSHLPEFCGWNVIIQKAPNFLLFAAFLLISPTVLIIKAKWGTQQQQPKRLDIVICLTVLFTLPLSLCNFLQQLGYMTVSSQVVFLLTCIHNSIKPFMYFLAGRCWRPCSTESLRLSLQRVFKEPEENTAHNDDATMDTVI